MGIQDNIFDVEAALTGKQELLVTIYQSGSWRMHLVPSKQVDIHSHSIDLCCC